MWFRGSTTQQIHGNGTGTHIVLRPSPLPFPRVRCHPSPAPARPPGQARVDDAEEPVGGPGKWIGDPELGCQVHALGARPPGVGWALAGVRTSGLQF